MYHLKLIKGLSYKGIVEATKTKPDVYTADKATADEAVASGYFRLLENESEERSDSAAEVNGKVISEMNVSELETFASYKGISLKGITKKADIIAKIREKISDEELEGEIEYGSPTMTELQD